MHSQHQSIQELHQIKSMMEKSSRFNSLSGLSGIAAGCCALVAIWFAREQMSLHRDMTNFKIFSLGMERLQLILILGAIITFIAAFALSFLFIYQRSKHTGVSVWGNVSFRVFINIAIPMAAGGLFIIRIFQLQYYELIVPICLIFYGLGLINSSKYTHREVRYLGYGQLTLGMVNLWLGSYGLYFWAIGFGVLHILFGMMIWNRYERTPSGS